MGVSSWRWPTIHKGSTALIANFVGPMAPAEAKAMMRMMMMKEIILRLRLLGEPEYLHHNNNNWDFYMDVCLYMYARICPNLNLCSLFHTLYFE